MKKVILTFGLISGIGLSLFLVLILMLWAAGVVNFDNGEWFGYSGMVVALSLIFFGIKSFRDNYSGGTITFVKGLLVGLLIALIASAMYAATWEVYAQIRPDSVQQFMDEYTAHIVEQERAAGATQAEIDAKIVEMKDMQESYNNPVVRFGWTLLEPLPVGILVTLVSAAILRRKEVLSAQPAASTASA